jgi:hypothetical protein
MRSRHRSQNPYSVPSSKGLTVQKEEGLLPAREHRAPQGARDDKGNTVFFDEALQVRDLASRVSRGAAVPIIEPNASRPSVKTAR